jgi:serine O-acetyltransferase
MLKLNKELMKENNYSYDSIIRDLSDLSENHILHHRPVHDMPMPSIENLAEIVLHLKKVLFPGFYGHSEVGPDVMNYYIGANIDIIFRMLSEQIMRGLCFSCDDSSMACNQCAVQSKELAYSFIKKLAEIKRLLSTDVIAAYIGDPAAKNYEEAIFCYPSISALTHHRIAHELLLLGVPILPRIISEMSHSQTGIDIHPGATIGEYFFIDHGTGVVIGETTVIGKNVRLYQGVTLGAKSFSLDEDGKPIKGIPRHPIVEDDVIIYSNSTILGRVTIGRNSTIGGNMWITEDVPPDTKVQQKK